MSVHRLPLTGPDRADLRVADGVNREVRPSNFMPSSCYPSVEAFPPRGSCLPLDVRAALTIPPEALVPCVRLTDAPLKLVRCPRPAWA